MKFIREMTKKYEIHARFFSFGIPSIDSVVKNEINKEIAAFKSDIADLDTMDYPYALYISYKTYINDNIRTVVLETYQFTGGAHGSTVLTPLYFDRHTLSPTTLDTYFRGDYLTRLSSLSEQKLLEYFAPYEMSDAAWIHEGTLPIKENFSNIIPMKEGLLIKFGQYQVAPYAAGMPEIFISNSEIKDILK